MMRRLKFWLAGRKRAKAKKALQEWARDPKSGHGR